MPAKKSAPKGRRLVQQLVLVFFLVLLWVMLWDTISVLSIVTGIILAFVITRVFYLPPVVLSGRFNLVHALVFAAWFVGSLVVASVEVAWFAFRRRAVGAGSVIACDLRTRSDLMMTLVADTASLIPGSIIVDSDRARGRLYLHVLDCDTEEKIIAAKKQVYHIEELLIRALGSIRDLAALKVDPSPLDPASERSGEVAGSAGDAAGSAGDAAGNGAGSAGDAAGNADRRDGGAGNAGADAGESR